MDEPVIGTNVPPIWGTPQEPRRSRFVPRFAMEAFAHEGSPSDGPMLRKLASTIAWKRPASATVQGEVSV